MNFPPITDFDEAPTVPAALMEVTRFDNNDVRASNLASTPLSETPLETIERTYPRIHRKIVATWGSQELQDAFAHWIFTDQEGRRGWPHEVATALILLSLDHADRFSKLAEPKTKVWQDRW